MNRRWIGLASAVLVAVLSVSPAQAGFFRAGELAPQSREFDKMMQNARDWNEVQAGFFMGFVGAIADAYGDELAFDEDMDVNQVCAVVGKFLRDHPETWNKPAAAVVHRALLEAFGPATTEPTPEAKKHGN